MPPTGTTSPTSPPPGGLTRVATIVDSLKARYPGQVVVVDAGDLIQGDPFATYFARVAPRDPNPVIEAMSLTGYDVATPGNHEFDWGLGRMRQAVVGCGISLRQRQHLHPAGRHPAVPALRGPAAGRGADRDHRLHHAGSGGVGPGPASGQAPGGPDSGRGGASHGAAPAGVGSGDCAGPQRDGWIRPPTTPPASGVRTWRRRWLRFRSRPDLVVWVTRTGRCGIQSSVACTSCSRGPMPGASPSPTWIWSGGERWRPVRMRASWSRLRSVVPSARLVQRLAPAHAAVLEWSDLALGEATGPMRAASARAGADPDSQLHQCGPAEADRCRPLGRVGVRPSGRLRQRHHPHAPGGRAVPLRQHAAGGAHQRGPAQGVPGAQRPVLSDRSGGADLDQ